MTMSCYQTKQKLSVFLIFSLIMSIWLTVAPINSADASLIKGAGRAVRSLFVNVGGLAAGVVTGAVGMAVGGGPLGMAVGGLGGYIVGKKVLNWTTSSVGNFATVAGAIAGGALCAGMGFPMLAVGVIGGGLIGKTVTSGLSKLFGKGKKNLTIAKSDIDHAAAAKEAQEVDAFIRSLQGGDNNATASDLSLEVQRPTGPSNSLSSQQAYELYTAAYKEYTTAVQAGDKAKAKTALENYRTYFSAYSQLLEQGK